MYLHGGYKSHEKASHPLNGSIIPKFASFMMLRLWIYIFKHVESRRDKNDEEAYALGAVLSDYILSKRIYSATMRIEKQPFLRSLQLIVEEILYIVSSRDARILS